MPRLKSLLWSSFFIFFQIFRTFPWPKSKECGFELREPRPLSPCLTHNRKTCSELRVKPPLYYNHGYNVTCYVLPSELTRAAVGRDLACDERRRSHSGALISHRSEDILVAVCSPAFSILIKQWCMVVERLGKRAEIIILLPSPLWPHRTLVRRFALSNARQHLWTQRTQTGVIDRTCSWLSSCLVFYNMLLFSGVHSGSLL